MDAQHIEEVIFVEVKSGSARLNHNEHSLKDAIENKRVRWHEYHVPTALTHTPEPQSNPRSKTHKSPQRRRAPRRNLNQARFPASTGICLMN